MKNVLLLLLLVCATLSVAAAPGVIPQTAMPTIKEVPAAARASGNFDANAATDAYLALIPPAARAKSDAYFEGGYWLILCDFVYGAVVALILLSLRWSAAMRNVAERMTRFKPLQTFIYWAEYTVVIGVLTFPLAAYEGFFREQKYGLATQTFGGWLGDQGKGLAINVILGGLVVMALVGIVRRMPRTWWIWGSIVTTAFLAFASMIAPVLILPLFNKSTILKDPVVTGPILRLARANGIPAHDVYDVDASKQSTRMSANVSGFGSTMRITLNDNLLRRGTPEEIQAIMGHEMGHYVLNHVYKGILEFFLVIVVWFAALQWALGWSVARWGERWQIRGIGDVAILPLVILWSSLFFVILTPVTNTIIRTQEAEADIFGINASRQPDGFAQAAIHLGEYRKMSPGPAEEFIFFDHPSGRNRIHAAMQWKAENQPR
jgi:STE24 endopeptidase